MGSMVLFYHLSLNIPAKVSRLCINMGPEKQKMTDRRVTMVISQEKLSTYRRVAESFDLNLEVIDDQGKTFHSVYDGRCIIVEKNNVALSIDANDNKKLNLFWEELDRLWFFRTEYFYFRDL